MTKLEKELTIKVKRLEDDCKTYNFTQHTLQEENKKLKEQIEKMKECANCPVWLLNQTERNCKDCKYKEALLLLRR
jgi:hypothetical protein